MHLGNQNSALRLDVVNFRSANFRFLNAHLRIADHTSTCVDSGLFIRRLSGSL